MDISSALTAQQSLFRQALGLSLIKQNTDEQKAAADMIAQSVQAAAPASSCRGTNVDLLA